MKKSKKKKSEIINRNWEASSKNYVKKVKKFVTLDLDRLLLNIPLFGRKKFRYRRLPQNRLLFVGKYKHNFDTQVSITNHMNHVDRD